MRSIDLRDGIPFDTPLDRLCLQRELPQLPSVVKRMVPRAAYPGPRPLNGVPATPTHDEFNDPEIKALVERFGIDFSHAAT